LAARVGRYVGSMSRRGVIAKSALTRMERKSSLWSGVASGVRRQSCTASSNVRGASSLQAAHPSPPMTASPTSSIRRAFRECQSAPPEHVCAEFASGFDRPSRMRQKNISKYRLECKRAISHCDPEVVTHVADTIKGDHIFGSVLRPIVRNVAKSHLICPSDTTIQM
jgi:hypothetical protein